MVQAETKAWFDEFEAHLLRDDAPAAYFVSLLEEGRFPGEYPFTMISDLKRVPQHPRHHPEGDVFNHTMQVVDLAASRKGESTDARAFMWAALLHDVGKKPTTKLRNGKLTAYDHDKAGEQLARNFLRRCTDDAEFVSRVCALVRWHMQVMFIAHGLPFADIRGMLRSVEPAEVALLAWCDRLGRGALSAEAVQRETENIGAFMAHCAQWRQPDKPAGRIGAK